MHGMTRHWCSLPWRRGGASKRVADVIFLCSLGLLVSTLRSLVLAAEVVTRGVMLSAWPGVLAGEFAQTHV